MVDENNFSTNAISYTLQGTNNAGNGKLIANVTTRTGINTTNIKLGRGNFTGVLENAVHTYQMYFYFYETNTDQSNDLGKTFRAHITMEKYLPVLLNNHIIGLAGTNQGTGKVINENGYRYEGLNPNNYVRFNNELWRIIGVFDSNTHNKTGQNLVKIIRSASIGNINWYTGHSTANWETASLKIYLNGTYYNGLSTASKNMIENVTWKLGGRSNEMASASTFYSTERGTVVYSGNAVSIVANIGLMYPSDWGYAVLGTSCPRSTRLSDYNTSACYNQNWLYIDYQEWTITHRNADGNLIVRVNKNIISSTDGTLTHVVRPVVYLKSNTLMMGGTGTSADPYIIE